MILFFYGEDNYRLKQKLKQLKEKFISASLGDTNLAVLDGKKATYDEIVRQTMAMPFLAKSRLVIVENLLKESKKDITDKVIDLLKKVPESTVLVFVEDNMPDKRTSLFKKLNQPKISQEFKLLEGAELANWVKSEAKNRGAEIEPAAVNKLIEYCGNDLWRIANELDKLTVYRLPFTEKEDGERSSVNGEPILVKDIELLVRPQIQTDIFALIEAVSAKNLPKSLRELHNLLENGEAELYLLTMIVYQFRNILIAKDLVNRSNGRLSQYDLAKSAGLHPFVAQKTLYQAKNYEIGELKKIYRTLLENDRDIKTGRIEPQTALDLMVTKLCN